MNDLVVYSAVKTSRGLINTEKKSISSAGLSILQLTAASHFPTNVFRAYTASWSSFPPPFLSPKLHPLVCPFSSSHQLLPPTCLCTCSTQNNLPPPATVICISFLLPPFWPLLPPTFTTACPRNVYLGYHNPPKWQQRSHISVLHFAPSVCNNNATANNTSTKEEATFTFSFPFSDYLAPPPRGFLQDYRKIFLLCAWVPYSILWTN